MSLSRQPSEMAAELGMRGPKKGDGLLLFSVLPIIVWCVFHPEQVKLASVKQDGVHYTQFTLVIVL